MSQSDSTEETIFETARHLGDPEKQAAYLDLACGKDEALRQRIEQLLCAGQRAKDFFQKQGAATLRIPQTIPTAPITEGPGSIIARYKLLQQIGEGGCGVVYMAEQEEPVRRRVALKVIKLGMDTKQVIARFEAERQALALMDHPNIAKVLDAGATETGRPYFVMELVRGIKITDYCDENNLSTQQRLKLFIQVCQGIQHAHQKGIIHRDIKPSNVLVADHDGVPVPKIIDFGIAKATTDQRLTDKTLFTAFEQFIGTPAYMSPEQAKLSGLDIDTRTDIYSLGVLLYELLTGKTPLDQNELQSAGLEEMRRTIREKEPLRPSTRLTQELAGADVTRLKSSGSAAEAETRASSRRLLQLKELIHVVRGDLDWIVMKALEKDRARRYETANSLANDVQRHLNNEPVLARPPSRLYEFQKTVRRHKFGFAAAAALTITLMIGLGVSTWLLIKEKAARQRAVAAEREQIRLREEADKARANETAQRLKAETEAARSAQVAQFMKDMLSGVGPNVAQGRDTKLLREILDNTARRLDKDLTGQPEVEADLRETMGGVYNAIADLAKSEAMHRRAVTLRRELPNTQPGELAAALGGLANALSGEGKLSEAEKVAQEALAIRRKASGTVTLALADSLSDLSSVLQRQGHLDEAEVLQQEALTIRRQLSGDVAASLRALGVIKHGQHKLAEAERIMAAGVEIMRKSGDSPGLSYSLAELSGVYSDGGKLAEAEAAEKEALEIQRKVYGSDNLYLLSTLWGLSSILDKEGKLAEAELALREAITIERSRPPNENPRLAELLFALAPLLKEQYKNAEAEEAYREALPTLPGRLQAGDPQLDGPLVLITQFLLDEQKFAEAEPVARASLALREKIMPDRWVIFNTRSVLGGILVEQKKYTEAEPLLLAGYEGLKRTEDKLPAAGKVCLSNAVERLVGLYQTTDRPDQAVEWRKKLELFNREEAERKAAAAPKEPAK